jgi:hypothetical protein
MKDLFWLLVSDVLVHGQLAQTVVKYIMAEGHGRESSSLMVARKQIE